MLELDRSWREDSAPLSANSAVMWLWTLSRDRNGAAFSKGNGWMFLACDDV